MSTTAVPHVRQHIGGAWRDAGNGRTFESRSPWSGEVVATVAAGDQDDTRDAIDAAHAAFGTWGESLPHERQGIFLRAADELERRRPSVVSLLARETGCARHFADIQLDFTISLLRQSGYDLPIYLHGAMLRLCALYEQLGVALGDLRPSLEVPKAELAGQIVIAPPSAIKDRWSRRLPDPVLATASGWMSVKQRARQAGVELPLVISDHADWNELRQTIGDTGAQMIWVTHGREDALVYWSQQQGLAAEPLRIEAYEDEAEAGE